MSEIAFGAQDEDGYRPKLAKQYRVALILIAFGALMIWPALQDFAPWFHGAAAPGGKAAGTAALAAFLVGFGILLLVGALRGLPRLTVSSDGIELETLFGTKWANWNSLSAFVVTTNYVGQFHRRILSASAEIVGPSISPNLRRKPKLTIPNVFLAPIDKIVSDLNQCQRRVLGVSRAAPTDAGKPQDGASFGLAEFTAPWLTFVMLAMLILVFAEEQLRALGPAGPMMRPSAATLSALGALNRTLVIAHGEWYRLFTAPLLHGDLSHIAGNGIALILVGFLLERLVGRAWYLAIFVVSGLAGSVMSLAINPATVTSVGASGAIMGLFAASFTASFRVPAGATRTNLQLQSARILIPSLLPLATGQIDYGAHLGGALGGTLAMLFLLKTWPSASRLPRFNGLAAGIAAIGIVLVGASLVEVGRHFPETQSRIALIPPNQVPKTQAEWQARASDLVELYPQDPRAHTYRGVNLAQAKDYAGAERELRLALTQAENLHSFFQPKFENGIRAALALVLSEENRWSEGKDIVLPACQAQSADRPPEELQKLLFNQHLCNG